ncbi:MAG: hypothetical protein QOG80_3060 [Pseudonocardiales bacterium]|jgi:DNA-binding MarR family transcriptional regulator|nr:hypothetical protein [Pseudonocardiales bacterium]
MPSTPSGAPPTGVAFLLAQLGAYAAQQFATALTDEDLTPPLAGILRMLWADSGLSQQQLAERLGTAPSRIVSYVDDLEARGWIARTRDTADRRVNALSLTKAGDAALGRLAVIGRAHEKRITAGLSVAEHKSLLTLLSRLADEHGLTPGVHPGYRLGGPAKD